MPMTMESENSRRVPPRFLVSAPGKVIVFGEHAAVYGQPAIAAAISLRSYLLVSTVPDGSQPGQHTVRLNFKDIGLAHSWDLDALPWERFREVGKRRIRGSFIAALNRDLLEAIRPHAEAVSADRADLTAEQRKSHQRTATAFLYLLLSLSAPDRPGFVYTLRSTIPTGAGLGSSASVCVCISTALLLQTGVIGVEEADGGEDAQVRQAQIRLIDLWAFVGELCLHGSPSGVDNAISAGGKAAIVYSGRSADGAPSVTAFPAFPRLPLLLVDTRQPRSTAAQVAHVKTLLPGKQPVIDAIGQLTTDARALLEGFGGETAVGKTVNGNGTNGTNSTNGTNGNTNGNGTNVATPLERLGELMRRNHELLVQLEVSHPRLERVRTLVDGAGVGWSKLTGAGGGGCAIVLLRQEQQTGDETTRALVQALAAEGFETHQTVLAGDGVGVLWPSAACHNGSNGSTADDIQLDEETLENAVGVLGVDKVVGHRQGWQFWTRAAV